MFKCRYGEEFREIVARRVLGKFKMNEWNHKFLNRPLYRSKEMRKNSIKEDKGTWLKKMGASSTLMVPVTRDSELARILRLILTSSSGPKGTTTKVVEVPGPAIFTGLAVNNPFLPEKCRRTDCPQIASNQPCKGKCAKERVFTEQYFLNVIMLMNRVRKS